MAGTRSKFVGGSLNFYDKTHNPSFPVGVWADCPLLAIRNDPAVGFIFEEDFSNFPAAPSGTTLAGWTVTQATTGQVSLESAANTPGGVLLIDSNSATATQGVQIQKADLIFKPAAGKDMWFECRLKIVDTFDKAEIFAGLSEIDTTLIASSANSSANHIGWQCVTDDGVLLFSSEKAGTGATKASVTIEEDTFLTLGFKINGVTDIEHWVNGAKIATTHVTANIPTVALSPSFVCQSGGTNDPIMHLDWVRCVQLR